MTLFVLDVFGFRGSLWYYTFKHDDVIDHCSFAYNLSSCEINA